MGSVTNVTVLFAGQLDGFAAALKDAGDAKLNAVATENTANSERTTIERDFCDIMWLEI
ncbi:MAG: hypothetical protein ACRDF4_06590 [Rhabdochlamydiaceae bacterium]